MLIWIDEEKKNLNGNLNEEKDFCKGNSVVSGGSGGGVGLTASDGWDSIVPEVQTFESQVESLEEEYGWS